MFRSNFCSFGTIQVLDATLSVSTVRCIVKSRFMENGITTTTTDSCMPQPTQARIEGHKHKPTMANLAAASAAVNAANFIINQKVDTETDLAMLRTIEDFSKSDVILGALTHEKLLADSSMVKCLQETGGKWCKCLCAWHCPCIP